MQILNEYFKYLENPNKEVTRQPSDSNYPSSASIEIVNSFGEKEIIGSCIRKEWYRRMGIEKSDKEESTSLLKMKAGKVIEQEFILDLCKMGIFYGSNIKFYIKQFNISAEVDFFVRIKDKIIGGELKTIYGDYADVEVLGKKPPFWVKIPETKGYPKLENLLQIVPYIWFWKEKGVTDEFHLIYLNRGSFESSREYIVTMDKDNYLIVDGVKNDMVGLEPIAKRFKLLDNYVEKKELPPRDYELKFSEPRAKELVDSKRKSAYWFGNWKKGKGICGNWQCSYCSYKTECWRNK
jgi:hypothetical protein